MAKENSTTPASDDGELIAKMLSEEELCGDDLHEWFSSQVVVDDWIDAGNEAVRLLVKAFTEDESGVVIADEYSLDAVITAACAQAYEAALKNAATYMGVAYEDLTNGVAEFILDERPSCREIVIPIVRYNIANGTNASNPIDNT